MEQWKVIIGFINYEVSNYGRVRNRKTGRILKTSLNDKGYVVVCLSKRGEQFLKKVHILVAEAFVDGYCRDGIVQFIDGDRTNVYADNLEWVARSELQQRTKIRRRKMGIIHNQAKGIRVIETGHVYESIADASKELGLSASSISKCLNYSFCHNRKGYHFEEVDLEDLIW